MKLGKTLLRLAFVAAVAGVSGYTFAAPPADVGKQEYDDSCANCHGAKGEGNGPYAKFLKSPPSNLTVLAKKNGGVFPFAQVYDTIDGRPLIGAHGRDMPIWGDRYTTEASQRFWDDESYAVSYVRGRIIALIDYLNRLQQK